MNLSRLFSVGIFAIPIFVACAPAGPGGASAVRPSRSAGRTRAIDPFDGEFRDRSWLCVLCPGAAPEEFPAGCAEGQTGFSVRYRTSFVNNPRPEIVVSAKQLKSYGASESQPVPEFMHSRKFNLVEFVGNRSYPVTMATEKGWVSFCYPSMDESDSQGKDSPPSQGLLPGEMRCVLMAPILGLGLF